MKQILIIYMKMKITIFLWNPKTFEQIEIKKDIVGERGKLMTENLESSGKFL